MAVTELIKQNGISPSEQTQPKNLGAYEVFTLVYEELKSRNPHQEINLEGPISTEVADDSDWHKTNTGYMLYDSAMIITVEDKNWLIAKATRTDGYPADRFGCDLTAIPYDPTGKSTEEIGSKAKKLIGESTYFRNSLIFALNNGRIGADARRRFGTAVIDSLPSPDTLIAQEMKVNRSIISLADFRPVVTSGIKYKPEVASVITESILKVLSNSRESTTQEK